jgi:hypothetical protein
MSDIHWVDATENGWTIDPMTIEEVNERSEVTDYRPGIRIDGAGGWVIIQGTVKELTAFAEVFTAAVDSMPLEFTGARKAYADAIRDWDAATPGEDFMQTSRILRNSLQELVDDPQIWDV